MDKIDILIWLLSIDIILRVLNLLLGGIAYMLKNGVQNQGDRH